MTVPSNLIAGDTWEWTRDLPDYPAGTWTLTYYFWKDGKSFSAAATADGSAHAVSVSAVTTADYSPGGYVWQARVTDGTDVYTVDEGWVTVKANPATANFDPRSDARITLEAVTCFLKGNATTAQASMTLNGRSISRWSLAELRQWQKELRQEVRDEERGSSAGLSRNIKVRFGRA
jgi:hypothetical protein